MSGFKVGDRVIKTVDGAWIESGHQGIVEDVGGSWVSVKWDEDVFVAHPSQDYHGPPFDIALLEVNEWEGELELL